MIKVVDKLIKSIKAASGWILFKSGAYRIFVDKHDWIIVFHSVSSSQQKTGINCSTDEFEKLCVIINRYFQPVPLNELFLDNSMESHSYKKSRVAITFDDGYKNNITEAAPILRNMKLPATFFVTTGVIGSEHQAEWDKEIGIRSEWMDWGDLRQLEEWGFEIGCHTHTHIDCAAENSNAVLSDIRMSQRQVREKLGHALQLFAFPFGGRLNLSEKAVKIVKGEGFSRSFSCYGGVIKKGSTKFLVNRMPFSKWYASPWHFMFDVILEMRGERNMDSDVS